MDLPDSEQKGILFIHRSGLPVRNDMSVMVMMIRVCQTLPILGMHFQANYHIVTMAYPFMDQDSLPADRKWGYTMKEVATALLALIQGYPSLGYSQGLLDWT